MKFLKNNFMTQAQALAIMKTGANVFLTGEPGAGKTHLVNQYVSYLRSLGIEPAITASTGIAATHIGGMTIHSWSGIGIKRFFNRRDLDIIAKTKRLAERIKATKVLIIDEISMLGPNTLEMVEAVCRRVKDQGKIFGGLQVILVGDFFQLPPVSKDEPLAEQSLLNEPSSRFVFSASAWQSAKLRICYLSEQYRQDDQAFLSVLNAIRANSFDETHLAHLRARQIQAHEVPDNLPKLYSHNVDVDRVNNAMLSKLSSKARVYNMTGHGLKHLVENLQRGCLSPTKLELKIGASVMFTKNNPQGLYVNGSLGVVIGFDYATTYPLVKLRTGQTVKAEPTDWLLEDGGETLARITQVPLRLAWAITVHKSQGMSMDGAVMDLSQVFEFGQGYVALSRVRRLSGLFLLGYNERAFQVSPEVATKDKYFRLVSEADLQALEALDEAGLTQRHTNFMEKIGGQPGKIVVRKNSLNSLIKKPKKPDTYKETLKLWQEGYDLEKIMELRRLTSATILNHLEKLGRIGKIRPEEFRRLISDELNVDIPLIHQVFHKLDTNSLSPVWQHFDGQYSYDDLRLARMTLNKKKK
jgi:ATP-dependent exoDNAse (exonuclease V) alpha subunit